VKREVPISYEELSLVAISPPQQLCHFVSPHHYRSVTHTTPANQTIQPTIASHPFNPPAQFRDIFSRNSNRSDERSAMNITFPFVNRPASSQSDYIVSLEEPEPSVIRRSDSFTQNLNYNPTSYNIDKKLISKHISRVCRNALLMLEASPPAEFSVTNKHLKKAAKNELETIL
jgi:hypothetical protein